VTEPTTPPHVSPDGYWRWDGHAWVPNTSYPPPYQQPVGLGRAGEGMALASVITGVAACGIGSIPAVILGHKSRKEARQAGQEPSTMATWGLVTGYLGIAVIVLFLVALMFGWGDESYDEPTYGAEVPSGPVAVALHSAADAEEGYKSEKGSYTAVIEDLIAYGYRQQPDVVVSAVVADEDELCMVGRDDMTTYWIGTADMATVVATSCG
jgi:hypothetical protein